MPSEMAIYAVNDIKNQVSRLARAIVSALADDKISVWEGMSLGMAGMQLGTAVLTVVQSYPPEVQKEILEVLEHSQLVMPEPRQE